MSIFRRLFNIARAEFSFDNLRRGTAAETHAHTPPYEEMPRDYPPPEPPPRQRTKIEEYYDALEVARGSDLKTVEKAWKKQMRRYHPDLHSSDPEKQKLAGEVTQILNQAYKELRIHLGG